MARIAALALAVAMGLASVASCGAGGRAPSTVAGGSIDGGADPGTLPGLDAGLTPSDGGPSSDGAGPASPPGSGAGTPPPGPGTLPPDAGTPSQSGLARWVASREFAQRGIASDGAGGAFVSNVRLPLHSPPAPPGSFVVGSDLARVDGAGHVLWSRTFGPAPGCGVFIGFELAPLPGGHLAASFSEEGCAVPVPELGGQTFEGMALVELDGDGRFVGRLADIAPAWLRASSDGGLFTAVGVPGATVLVKLGGDGAELWRVPAANLAGSFVSDVAPDREGGAVIAVVDDEASGAVAVTHLRRFGPGGELLWNRDLPPQMFAPQVAVLTDGTAVAPGFAVGDVVWGRGRVQVPAGGGGVLLSVGPDGAPRDAVAGDAAQVTALPDGSLVAYGQDCHMAHYTARLEQIWSRFIASLPGAPPELCRAVIAQKGAVGASASLVIVAGQEDAASDFGGGLVAEGEGFVVGLTP